MTRGEAFAARDSTGRCGPSYGDYLALDRLLDVQRPLTGEHDELLFIIVHQAHELWFKLLLHELGKLERDLRHGRTAPALHTLHRTLAVLRVLNSQMDVVETMLPSRFASFRAALGDGSGAQSTQFRAIEAALGGPAGSAAGALPAGRMPISEAVVRYLSARGYPVPGDARSPADLQAVLREVYQEDGVATQVCERLVDLDQAVQLWRYRHAALAQRLIGDRVGTGGSTGAAHLRSRVFTPAFAALADVRNGSAA